MITDHELLELELAQARAKLESIHNSYRNGWISAAAYHSAVKMQEARIAGIRFRLAGIRLATGE